MWDGFLLFLWFVAYFYFLYKFIKSRYRIWLLFFFFAIPSFSKFWYASPSGDAGITGKRVVYCMILPKSDCSTYYVYKVLYAYNGSKVYTENGCGLLGVNQYNLVSEDGSENHINDFMYLNNFDKHDESPPQDYCGAYTLSSALCDNHINFYKVNGSWGGFNVDLGLICNYEDIAGLHLYPVPDLYSNIIFSVYGVNCDNFKFVYSNGQTAKLIYKLVKKDDTSQIIAWVVSLSQGSVITSGDTSSGTSTVLIPEVYFMFVSPEYWNEASHCITVDYYKIDVQSQNVMGSFWAIEKHIHDLTGMTLTEFYLVLNGAESFNVKFQEGIKCFDNNDDGSNDDGNDGNVDDDNNDDNNPFEDNNDDDNSDNPSCSGSGDSGQQLDYSYDEDSLDNAHSKVEEVFEQLGEALGSHFNGLYSLAQTLTRQNPQWAIDLTNLNLDNVPIIEASKFDTFIQKMRSLLKWVFSYIFLMSFIKRLTPGD